MPITRPVIETCWKKTYLMPSASIRRVRASIFSSRPGALRASSSVAGAGAIRGLERTVSTLPPNCGVSTSVAISTPSSGRRIRAQPQWIEFAGRPGPRRHRRGGAPGSLPLRPQTAASPICAAARLDKLVHGAFIPSGRGQGKAPRLRARLHHGTIPLRYLQLYCVIGNSKPARRNLRVRSPSLLHPDAGHRRRRPRPVHGLASRPPGARTSSSSTRPRSRPAPPGSPAGSCATTTSSPPCRS